MKPLQKGFNLIELMIVVAIIGILAAVAIPAYQDYSGKAQASEAFVLLDGLKTPMLEQFIQDATWTTLPTGAVSSGKYVASVTPLAVSTTGGTLTVAFAATDINSKLVGKNVVFTYNNIAGSAQGGWTCTSTLAAEIKPKSC